ncbi:MAG: hypothetical protein FWG36_00645 [Oscillospiraceae bacterium]|nr:hypothetical protein [Oscillospiraceae bacterium]
MSVTEKAVEFNSIEREIYRRVCEMGCETIRDTLRSVGVRAANLIDSTQTSLFNTDEYVIMVDISSRLKALTERFGKLEVESAGALGRWQQCAEDIRC